jgi:hypothetical protein
VCTTCAHCYSCHYKIERMEKKNEMKRRTTTLKRVNPLKAVQRQSMYEVIFVTCKIAD